MFGRQAGSTGIVYLTIAAVALVVRNVYTSPAEITFTDIDDEGNRTTVAYQGADTVVAMASVAFSLVFFALGVEFVKLNPFGQYAAGAWDRAGEAVSLMLFLEALGSYTLQPGYFPLEVFASPFVSTSEEQFVLMAWVLGTFLFVLFSALAVTLISDELHAKEKVYLFSKTYRRQTFITITVFMHSLIVVMSWIEWLDRAPFMTAETSSLFIGSIAAKHLLTSTLLWRAFNPLFSIPWALLSGLGVVKFVFGRVQDAFKGSVWPRPSPVVGTALVWLATDVPMLLARVTLLQEGVIGGADVSPSYGLAMLGANAVTVIVAIAFLMADPVVMMRWGADAARYSYVVAPEDLRVAECNDLLRRAARAGAAAGGGTAAAAAVDTRPVDTAPAPPAYDTADFHSSEVVIGHDDSAGAGGESGSGAGSASPAPATSSSTPDLPSYTAVVSNPTLYRTASGSFSSTARAAVQAAAAATIVPSSSQTSNTTPPIGAGSSIPRPAAASTSSSSFRQQAPVAPPAPSPPVVPDPPSPVRAVAAPAAPAAQSSDSDEGDDVNPGRHKPKRLKKPRGALDDDSDSSDSDASTSTDGTTGTTDDDDLSSDGGASTPVLPLAIRVANPNPTALPTGGADSDSDRSEGEIDAGTLAALATQEGTRLDSDED